MMSRIDRLRRAVSTRRAARTPAERTEGGSGAFDNALVPVGPVTAHRALREDWRRGDNEFEAQLLGQDGERRGLRAGPSLLQRARAAYSRIEWSGAYDRRARKGRHAREDI